MAPVYKIMIASQLLLDARVKRERLPDLPEDVRPANQQQAYQCQERVIDRLIGHYAGETVGYKIACTNAVAQRLLSMPEPFYGRLLSASTFDSPARHSLGLIADMQTGELNEDLDTAKVAIDAVQFCLSRAESTLDPVQYREMMRRLNDLRLTYVAKLQTS